MKCTNKVIAILMALVLGVSVCGCSKVTSSYQLYDSANGITANNTDSNLLFSSDLCVTDGTDFGTENVDSKVATGAGCFNLETQEVLYSQNIYGQLYPASTTKILTAYIILKYANLDSSVKVSELAVDQEDSSSVCDLKVGDTLTYRQLLYGLMLKSGNDAAIALAEGFSGSTEAFAELMNEEAKAIGATKSHFVTPNGLHDDDHYTTVYDMYLIFNAALEYEEFVNIISTASYDAYYTNYNGETVSKTWANTNGYLSGAYKTPDGFTIIGGKTGTTGDAGYCLVLLSRNEKNEPIISIVFGADCRNNLYLLMNEVLRTYAVSDVNNNET